MSLNDSAPIYTTRKHGRTGETGQYSQSIWMTLVAQLLVWANVVVWGVIGIVYAVVLVVNAIL